MADRYMYTIAWICSCDIEFNAAIAFLDERHPNPLLVVKSDPNIYALGKMHERYVVIASRRDGEYGRPNLNCPVNTFLVRSFPNVRCGLLVGLGGGAPTLNQDVQLGDVVVGDPDKHTSGVIAYNVISSILHKKFCQDWALNMAPREIRKGQDKLFTELKQNSTLIVEVAADTAKKTSDPSIYSRPHAEPKRLVDPLCKIHYGLIASGHKLMDNDQVRNIIAVENNILCFETEAAMILNDLPCVVIKGICDFAGPKKTTRWRGWATMTAGAYAKCLLKHMALETPRQLYDMLPTQAYRHQLDTK